MKIITSNAAFIQKKDLDFLIHKNLDLPDSVVLRIHGDVPIDENNKYEFVKFTLRKEIKYFKNLDWLIDYKQINKLSEDEMIELYKKTAKEVDNIAYKYNELSNQEKLTHPEMIVQSKLLKYKMQSIKDALWFKQGHIDMNVPETKYDQIINKIKKKTP